MQASKLYCIFFGILILTGCVEPFDPDISGDTEYIVIEGNITNTPEMKMIKVSKTSKNIEQKDIPLSGCIVKVVDDKKNVFLFNEDKINIGTYYCNISPNFLTINSAFKLFVETPSGKKYESYYEELLPCPKIDSVYFEVIEKPRSDPKLRPIYGVQFYIDVNTNGNYAEQYMWKLSETYIYTAKHLLTDYFTFEDKFVTVPWDQASDSLFTCWKSSNIRSFYTFSTLNSASKNIKKLALNFVSNQTVKLKIKYCLKVYQYSITKRAYEYWNSLSVQSTETGGLYESQPSVLKGNIYCVNDTNEVVLGYFGASVVQTKYYFISDILPFGFGERILCEPEIIDIMLLNEMAKTRDVIYLYKTTDENGNETSMYMDQQCFDCRLSGGTIYKPDFWED